MTSSDPLLARKYYLVSNSGLASHQEKGAFEKSGCVASSRFLMKQYFSAVSVTVRFSLRTTCMLMALLPRESIPSRLSALVLICNPVQYVDVCQAGGRN